MRLQEPGYEGLRAWVRGFESLGTRVGFPILKVVTIQPTKGPHSLSRQKVKVHYQKLLSLITTLVEQC